MPVGEFNAPWVPFSVRRCPTPEFHGPDRYCGNCRWRPSMHPDYKLDDAGG